MQLQDLSYDQLFAQLSVIWSLNLQDSVDLVKVSSAYDVATGNMVSTETVVASFKAFIYNTTNNDVMRNIKMNVGQGSFTTMPIVVYVNPTSLSVVADVNAFLFELRVDSILKSSKGTKYVVKEVTVLPNLDHVFTVKLGCVYYS